jgi:hypothetical protein
MSRRFNPNFDNRNHNNNNININHGGDRDRHDWGGNWGGNWGYPPLYYYDYLNPYWNRGGWNTPQVEVVNVESDKKEKDDRSDKPRNFMNVTNIFLGLIVLLLIFGIIIYIRK